MKSFSLAWTRGKHRRIAILKKKEVITMAKDKSKLKMSNRTYRRIWVTIVAVIVVLAMVLSIAAAMFSNVLDSYLGSGKLQIKRASGTSSWNAMYNSKATGSMAQAKAASDKVSEQVTDEGITLLKNNGVLPLKGGSTVTPYGHGFMDPAYSGTGAAATKDKAQVTAEQGLANQFKVNTASVDAMKKAKAQHPNAAKGTPALDSDKNSLQAVMDKGKSTWIDEYDSSIYAPIAGSAAGSTALVFIRRNGSEGIDKRAQAYDDGTPHYLALTSAEKNTIKTAKQQCGKVVVVLNTANPMELGPVMSGELEADAIVWMGTSGSRGFDSLGKILAGKVNPSGRLGDIYATDFTKDPTYVNFGEFHYTNAKVTDNTVIGDLVPGGSFGTINRPFVEYEEGIYVGYRYYETAAVEDPQFVYGKLDGKGGVATPGAVAYPFGYGLSYTSFKQTLDSVKEQGDDIVSQVSVTNTGNTPGKSTAEIYYSAPYTDYDRTNKVEKSSTVLGAFAKTDTLAPGKTQQLTLRFHKSDMASYDYHHANPDKTKGAYAIEAGDYQIDLKSDSHTVIASQHVNVPSTTWFTGKNPTTQDKNAQSELNAKGKVENKPQGKAYKAASNEFGTLNDYMDSGVVTQLSRSNWKGTFPTMPKDRQEAAPQAAVDEFNASDHFNPQTDKKLGNVPGSEVYAASAPASGKHNNLQLIDLRGLDYNDPKWNQLLDQINWKKDKKSIQALLYMAAYQTKDVVSIGKPMAIDKDGAMGWSVKGASSWAGANVMAATWNVDLLKKVGSSIGEEALQSGLNGWYAPAINTHRSPFGGRAYEFYSEDGLLAGKLAAASMSGAGDKGVYSYVKHVALNDQETFRSEGLATWANEQAIREIYLKPFQIASEEARSTERYLDNKGQTHTKTVRSPMGMMSAQNYIGGVIGFAHRGLLTGVLRGEWNFQGAVVTDLFLEKSKTQRDMTMRAGSDMYMIQVPGYNATDYDSPTAQSAMRTAIHNIAYMTVNSNAMNNITPGARMSISMPNWQKALVAVDVVVLLFAALMILLMVRRAKDESRNPGLYKVSKKGKDKAEKAEKE